MKPRLGSFELHYSAIGEREKKLEELHESPGLYLHGKICRAQDTHPSLAKNTPVAITSTHGAVLHFVHLLYCHQDMI